MASRIWEIHSAMMGGTIRTTPDGDANVEGLVLSEKAYLLAVRDFRPRQLVEMVRQSGPEGAADTLVSHYKSADSLAAMGGRSLVLCRGLDPVPVIRRSDEVAAKPPAYAARR